MSVASIPNSCCVLVHPFIRTLPRTLNRIWQNCSGVLFPHIFRFQVVLFLCCCFFSRPYFVRVAVPGQPFPFRPSSVRCRGRLYTCYTLTRFLRDIRLRTVIDWTQLERYIMAWPICGFPWKIYMYSFCLLRVLLAKRFFVIHIYRIYRQQSDIIYKLSGIVFQYYNRKN